MKVLLMCFNSTKRENVYKRFKNYSYKCVSPNCFELNDPSLVVLKVDVSKVPFLFKQKAKKPMQVQVLAFAVAVLKALPKTWTVVEYDEFENVSALKLVFSIGDGMTDLVSHSPLYCLERLNDCPLKIYSYDVVMGKYEKCENVPDPCVLDRTLWNLICQTLNSESEKAFSAE